MLLGWSQFSSESIDRYKYLEKKDEETISGKKKIEGLRMTHSVPVEAQVDGLKRAEDRSVVPLTTNKLFLCLVAHKGMVQVSPCSIGEYEMGEGGSRDLCDSSVGSSLGLLASEGKGRTNLLI